MKIRKHAQTIAMFLIMAFGWSFSWADVRYTPEQRFVRNIRGAIEGYAHDHGNQLPSDWKELEPYLDFDVLSGHEESQLPFRKYFLFNKGPQMLPPEVGQVVLLGKRTIRERFKETRESPIDEREGRYVVWVDQKAIFHHKFISESEARQLIKAAVAATEDGAKSSKN